LLSVNEDICDPRSWMIQETPVEGVYILEILTNCVCVREEGTIYLVLQLGY
jgi:hypothetical protein